MKLSTLAALLNLLATSYASPSYILDSSCAAFEDVLTSAFKGAFVLAQAGADAMDNVAASVNFDSDAWKAQRDLVDYMFHDALTDEGAPNIDTTNPNVFKTFLCFPKELIILCGCTAAVDFLKETKD